MIVDTCADCSVRDKALCSSLSDAELARLNAISRHQSFAKGTTLMWAGDESIVCGNVLSGVLTMTARTADGREQIVGLLYASDFVGIPEPGMVPFSITALTDTQICVFPRDSFERLLGDYRKMERLLLRRTTAALQNARSRMLMLSRGTSEEKVAAFFLEMTERLDIDGQDDSITFTLPFSRGQIADILGLTLETVSRQISHLKAERIISLSARRSITILSRDRLMQRAMIV